MTKKDKVVDLKPKADKITEEKLKKLQVTVNTINQIQMEIGRMETQKHNIMHNLAHSQKTLMDMQDEFKKDYGTYDINIADGTINHTDEQVNKKN